MSSSPEPSAPAARRGRTYSRERESDGVRDPDGERGLRLASALAANTVAEKRQILAKLTSDEILQMGHVNKLCDPIAASANQLDHALSAEWANVNLGAHGLARHAFQKLQDREWGLQQLFNETIVAPVAEAELDDWIRKKIGELLEMGTAATKLVSALTAAI